MNAIGVGVEGPSDLLFWRKVLHRSFPGTRFVVHNMSNRPELIRRTGQLLDAFRDAHYAAGIIVLDLDKNPCVADLLALFNEGVRTELMRALQDRFLFLCVARPKMEGWYLADSEAIRAVLGVTDYEPPADTGRMGKGDLQKLCRRRGISYNTVCFAEQIASKFDVDRAKAFSSSLRVAWARIETAVERAAG